MPGEKKKVPGREGEGFREGESGGREDALKEMKRSLGGRKEK